jgi:hypothetical protein
MREEEKIARNKTKTAWLLNYQSKYGTEETKPNWDSEKFTETIEIERNTLEAIQVLDQKVRMYDFPDIKLEGLNSDKNTIHFKQR